MKEKYFKSCFMKRLGTKATILALFLVLAMTGMAVAQVNTANISGMKFNDLNDNGIRDPGEPGLANWTITLTALGQEFPLSTLTDSNGNYTFTGLIPGNYTVEEVLQPGWIQTAPIGGTYNIVLNGTDVTGIDFGNFNNNPQASDFSRLISDINVLPVGAIGSLFKANISAARAAVNRNESCTAINILEALRNEIKARTGVEGFTPQMAGQINADVISIIAALYGRPDTASCGGGTASASGVAPVTTIVSSETNGLQLHINLPQAHFASRTGDGQVFTDVSMDGMGYINGVSKPDIPALTQLFAVPLGADVSVQMLGSTSYVLKDIKLWPRQEQPVDINDTFGDKPFTINTSRSIPN